MVTLGVYMARRRIIYALKTGATVYVVILFGRLLLSAGSLAVLRLLARSPGVVTREQLLAVLPGASHDPHAAEVAVARLRTGLGHPGVIRTVYRRGYQLAPPASGTADDLAKALDGSQP